MNGYGEKVKKILAELPMDVIIDNPAMKGSVQWFMAFILAPIDLARGAPRKNGSGLTPYGYYSCAPARGIDRVMGLDVIRKTLLAADNQMNDLRDEFCRYCGHFIGRSTSTDKQVIRPAWNKAYKNYAQEKM